LAHAEEARSGNSHWDNGFEDPAFVALQVRLDDVIASIDRLPDSLSIRTLDERVKFLAQSLEQLALHSRRGQPEIFGMIDERLDEISRAIAASTAMMHTTGIDRADLDRIDARIGSLTHQINELTAEQSPAPVVEHLIALTDRVDDIARRIQ